MVKPYHIVNERFGPFAEGFPPFPRGMDLGCGITFDIFTHVFTRVVLKFIIIYTHKKKKKKKYKLAIWTRDIMLT